MDGACRWNEYIVVREECVDGVALLEVLSLSSSQRVSAIICRYTMWISTASASFKACLLFTQSIAPAANYT